MTLRHLDLNDCASLAAGFIKPYHKNYFAMYSSVLGGVVTHPFLMSVPVDDHMVQRGDGIFETFKCVDGRLYNFERHLDRLERSARSLHLKLPAARPRIVDIVKETIRIGGARDCLMRLFVSRGPGGFTVNPYECPESQLYVVACSLSMPSETEYARGVTVKSSSVPAKKPFFANVKSCNYLPNVLMKKEAVDSGVDYTISLDEGGYLAEGAAENIAIVGQDNVMKLPVFSRILRGTTVSRGLELAQELVDRGSLKGISFEDIPLAEAYNSSETLIFGTSFDVVAAVLFDGQPIGTGKPGPVFQYLHQRFQWDVRSNPAMQIPVFEE